MSNRDHCPTCGTPVTFYTSAGRLWCENGHGHDPESTGKGTVERVLEAQTKLHNGEITPEEYGRFLHELVLREERRD